MSIATRLCRRLRATACHEAGHAVAAWHTDLKFRRVTIKPEDDSLEHLLHSRFPKWFNPELDKGDRARMYAEHLIEVGFAGQLAEAKFRGRRPRFGMRSDSQSAVDTAIWFHEPGKTLDAYLRYCWCVSENLVNFRWREIEALAVALLERETLNYLDAIEIICPGSAALRASFARMREQMARAAGASEGEQQ